MDNYDKYIKKSIKKNVIKEFIIKFLFRIHKSWRFEISFNKIFMKNGWKNDLFPPMHPMFSVKQMIIDNDLFES